jgi:hypothetical protein
MTEERKFAILFAATILCARKLATLENDRPSPAKPAAVENAIKPSQLHTPAHSIALA